MQWTVVDCSRCESGVLVPAEVGERVRNGESHVMCEACIEDMERAG